MIDDEKIIELFFERSEQAIRELDIKYGKICHNLSYNIVNSRQDAEECVNDAYLGAWNAIPPVRPNPLLSYIVKIVRNISLKIYWRKEAAKRSGHYTIALEEIEGCIADQKTVEDEIEARELARIIEAFLDTLTVKERVTTRPYNWCGATVANILSNPVYLGHTLNMQSSTLSYKNKQIFHRPPEEQVLVKNTHEAIIDQESWDTVQRVREHKRRPPKHMDAPGLFAGLVYCTDCGGYMVLCRTGKMKPEQYYFRCSTYGKRGKDACTPHHITEANLNAIVLDDLRRVTHFARTKKHQFAAYINRKNTAQLRKEMTATQRELDKMVKRNSDLSVLFKRLYEDNVLGKISNEQFRMLSADYNTEQKQLAAAIPEKQAKLEKLKASAANVDAFIEKASRYTDITELTPELLWLFIERIDIGERPGRYNRNGMQEVRIIYRDIGVVDSTMSAEDAESAEVHFIPSLEMVVQQMAAQTQVS